MTQYHLHSSSPFSPQITPDSLHTPHLVQTLPPNHLIYTTTSSNTLHLVDTSTQKQRAQFTVPDIAAHGGILFLDCFSPGSDGSGTTDTSNNQSSAPVSQYILVGGLNAMVLLGLNLSDDNNAISTAAAHPLAVYKWNRPLEAFTGCFIRKLSSEQNGVTASVAIGGSHGIAIYDFIKSGDTVTGSFEKRITLSSDQRKNSFIMSLKSSSYHPILVSGNKDGLITVWNLNNGRVIHQLAGEGYSDTIRTIDLCEKVSKKSLTVEDQIIDTFIIAGSDDAYIRVYDFNTGKLVKALKHDHHGAFISSVRVSHSSNHLCSVTINGSIHMYDVSTLGQTNTSQLEQAEFRGVLSECGSIWACVFSPDDSNVYFTHDNGIAQMSS